VVGAAVPDLGCVKTRRRDSLRNVILAARRIG
jgi:hypothetical protein